MSRPPQDGPMLGWLSRLPERGYRSASLLTVLAVLLLVGTGGWVRLSESGLGCSTWPRCYATVLQGAVGYVRYFGALPAGLIEAHIAGAGILVIAAVRFNLALGPGTPGWAARKSPGTGKPGLPRWTRWRAAAQRSGGGSSGMTAPGPAVLEDGHACMMLLSPTEWSG